MSLQTIQLDDLTWIEMIDAIRARIVADSNGEWTMHGPLDPGVTLLELFAYLFEQRLYWLDQVPEPLVRAILALLDDAPLRTACAKTLLAFRSLDDGLPQEVSAGTVFYPRDQQLLLPLSTLESATVLPVNYNGGLQPRIELISSCRDHSPDLHAGYSVPMLPADGSASELQFILWLDRHLMMDEIDGTFTLYFELDTATSIAPEWAGLPNDIQWFDRTSPVGYVRRMLDTNDVVCVSCNLPRTYPETGVSDFGSTLKQSTDPPVWINEFISTDWSYRHLQITPPAELKLYYSTGSDTRKAFDSMQFLDATGGLRRSGLVRFIIQEDWQPIITQASGLVGYAIWITCEKSTYSAPPRLRRLIPNVVVAQHVESVDMDWGEIKDKVNDWLRLPGQELRLPVDKPEPLEDSVRLHFREDDQDWHEWRPTDHFYHHGPEDRVFIVDRTHKRLLFGNGLTGRIPVLDIGNEPYVKLCYLAGGGDGGNFGELVWASRTSDLKPFNPVPGIGGADAETMSEAKARVGRDLSRRERAVTAVDFEWLAKSTPGIAIARAHAAVGYHPGFPCHPVPGVITLFVVPEVPREALLFESGEAVLAPKTDPGALAEVRRRIDTRRLLTSEVYVCSVPYRAVTLVVELQGVFVDQESLQAEISLVLTQYLDPLIGGDQGEGWPFGGPLRPSSLIKEIQKHIDASIIIKRVEIALDSGGFFEDCSDVAIGQHHLVYLQAIRFNVDRTPVTQGGLR